MLRSLALTTAFAVVNGSSAVIADTEMEYEADEGYHEEEWYDPSDWFNDDNQISYETDDGWDDSEWYDSYYDTYWYDTDYDQADYDAYHPVGYVYYIWDTDNSEWAESGRQTKSRNATGDKRSGNRGTMDRSSRIDGRIDGFKKVSLSDHKGVKQNHSFVKVKLENGKSRVISLGERVDTADLSLKKGDKITASGKVVKVDGKKILLADTIRTGGETFRISDDRQPQLRRSGDKSMRGDKSKHDKSMVTRSGTLEDSERVKLDSNKRSDHLIVRIEMKDGRECVADFGPKARLSDLGLDEGDTVRIKGCTTKVNDKKLIVAREVRVDGEKQNVRDGKSSYSRGESSSDGTRRRDRSSAKNS